MNTQSPSDNASGHTNPLLASTPDARSDTTLSSLSPILADPPSNGFTIGPICIGHGIDVTAIGVLASTAICSVVGLSLWVSLQPPARPTAHHPCSSSLRICAQNSVKYTASENGLSPPSEFRTGVPAHARRPASPALHRLRPKPLRKTFWAFLRPHVPLVPSIPDDVSSYSAGRHPHADAALFPSDEELAQRTLWHAFLLVLAWSVVGVVGALPLYLVATPCLAAAAPPPRFGGQYSTLQDLSLLRLLDLLRDTDIGGAPRATVDGRDVTRNTEIRLIVLAVLAVAVAAVPAVVKLLYEYSRLVDYRRRWIAVRCDGLELGWLARARAPGLDGWGETRLKDFLIKTGLSRGFKNSGVPREGFAGVGANGRSTEGLSAGRDARDRSHTPPRGEEEAVPEVDLQGLFTVACVPAVLSSGASAYVLPFSSDTTRLAALILERDVILNNLELAETRYINSFTLSTPSPSVVDFEAPQEPKAPPPDEGLKQRIGRPRALSGSMVRRPAPIHASAEAQPASGRPNARTGARAPTPPARRPRRTSRPRRTTCSATCAASAPRRRASRSASGSA